MKYTRLDFLDREISHIALGTDYFGREIAEKVCFDVLDKFISLGGNVIDTARMYCSGISEETVGKWINERKMKNKVTVITKCAHHEGTGRQRLSFEEIESDIDKSLKALRTEKIDLLFLHRDDVERKTDEIIETLNAMVKKGKILSFGASNWRAERIKNANSYARKKNI